MHTAVVRIKVEGYTLFFRPELPNFDRHGIPERLLALAEDAFTPQAPKLNRQRGDTGLGLRVYAKGSSTHTTPSYIQSFRACPCACELT